MHDANPSHLDLQAIAKTIMQQRGFEFLGEDALPTENGERSLLIDISGGVHDDGFDLNCRENVAKCVDKEPCLLQRERAATGADANCLLFRRHGCISVVNRRYCSGSS